MRPIAVLAALVVVALLGACSGGAPAASSASIAAGSGAAEALDGSQLYAANCAMCHGGNLKGTFQGPPFLDAIYQPSHHSDAAFLIAVRRGVQPHHWNFGPMPAIQGLTDAQVAAIVAFVRAEQQAVGIR